MRDLDFDAKLDAYQARLYEEAEEARDRSYLAAARPDADPETVTFADLMVGDYMTNEDPSGRWVKVVEIRGAFCRVKSGQQAVADDHLSVMFEIPEPVTVSGETHYWIDRPATERVLIDKKARHSWSPSQ